MKKSFCVFTTVTIFISIVAIQTSSGCKMRTAEAKATLASDISACEQRPGPEVTNYLNGKWRLVKSQVYWAGQMEDLDNTFSKIEIAAQGIMITVTKGDGRSKKLTFDDYYGMFGTTLRNGDYGVFGARVNSITGLLDILVGVGPDYKNFRLASYQRDCE